MEQSAAGRHLLKRYVGGDTACSDAQEHKRSRFQGQGQVHDGAPVACYGLARLQAWPKHRRVLPHLVHLGVMLQASNAAVRICSDGILQ